MKNYRKRTFKKDDRQGEWIRIRHPSNQGTTEKDMREWTAALRSLQVNNPELYSKVVHQHLVVEPAQFRRDWLDSKYAYLKSEADVESGAEASSAEVAV
jgi:hypothetical protein